MASKTRQDQVDGGKDYIVHGLNSTGCRSPCFPPHQLHRPYPQRSAAKSTAQKQHRRSESGFSLFLISSSVSIVVLREQYATPPRDSPDGDAVRQVHGKHSCRRPAIQKPCVGRIAAVRIPDGREVGAAVVGAVGVGFELECRASPGDICLQQPPTVLIAKLWEIGHCILRRRDSCTLICGDFLRSPSPERHSRFSAWMRSLWGSSRPA